LKYIDQYRDINVINTLAGEIKAKVKHPWNLMEICGGQTHSIMKYNLTEFLPKQMEAGGAVVVNEYWRSVVKEGNQYALKMVYDIVVIKESGVCIEGEILRGICKPTDCRAFGKECVPENPSGAPMVSMEGTCYAYIRYQQKYE